MQTVHVRWLELRQPTLLFEFEDGFVVEDYVSSVAQARDLLEEREVENFYVVGDISQVQFIPPMMISQMLRAYSQENTAFAGHTIIVGAPSVIAFAVTSFQHLFRTSKFSVVDSLDDVPRTIQALEF